MFISSKNPNTFCPASQLVKQGVPFTYNPQVVPVVRPQFEAMAEPQLPLWQWQATRIDLPQKEKGLGETVCSWLGWNGVSRWLAGEEAGLRSQGEAALMASRQLLSDPETRADSELRRQDLLLRAESAFSRALNLAQDDKDRLASNLGLGQAYLERAEIALTPAGGRAAIDQRLMEMQSAATYMTEAMRLGLNELTDVLEALYDQGFDRRQSLGRKAAELDEARAWQSLEGQLSTLKEFRLKQTFNARDTEQLSQTLALAFHAIVEIQSNKGLPPESVKELYQKAGLVVNCSLAVGTALELTATLLARFYEQDQGAVASRRRPIQASSQDQLYQAGVNYRLSGTLTKETLDGVSYCKERRKNRLFQEHPRSIKNPEEWAAIGSDDPEIMHWQNLQDQLTEYHSQYLALEQRVQGALNGGQQIIAQPVPSMPSFPVAVEPSAPPLEEKKDSGELFRLGQCHERDHQLGQALQCYQELLSRGVVDSMVYRRIGLVYAKLGDFDKAVSSLTQASQKDPLNSSIVSEIAALYVREGQLMFHSQPALLWQRYLMEAMARFNQAWNLNPGDHGLQESIGECQAILNKESNWQTRLDWFASRMVFE